MLNKGAKCDVWNSVMNRKSHLLSGDACLIEIQTRLMIVKQEVIKGNDL